MMHLGQKSDPAFSGSGFLQVGFLQKRNSGTRFSGLLWLTAKTRHWGRHHHKPPVRVMQVDKRNIVTLYGFFFL
jgi:hypothetical protein